MIKKFICLISAAAVSLSAVSAAAINNNDNTADYEAAVSAAENDTSVSSSAATFTYGVDNGSAVLLSNGLEEQSSDGTATESARATVVIKDTSGKEYFNAAAPAKQTEGDTELIKFELSEAVTVQSLTINDKAAEYWFTGTDNKTLYIAEREFGTSLDTAESVEVTITVSAAAASASTLALTYFNSSSVTDNGVTYEGNAVSAFGQVQGNVGEFGMLFGTESGSVDSYTGSYEGGGNAYPALGKNSDGQYVIQLLDTAALPEYIYARAYYKDTDGNVHYADKIEKHWSGGIESLTLGSCSGVVDETSKTVTIDLPLFDSNGSTIDISDLTLNITTKAEAQEVIVGSDILNGSGTSFSGTFDASNGGKNIFLSTSDGVVGYKLNVYRYYEESFDNSYVTAFTKSYSGSAWSRNDNPITGNAGSIWSWAQSANSGDNAAYGFSALKKTAWDYMKIGVASYSDVKTKDSTELLPVSENSGANPSGNSLAAIKSMAFQGKDSSMMSIYLGKGSSGGDTTADGGMTGLNTATEFSVEYDIAYDYNMKSDFSVDGTDYKVYKSPLTAGMILIGKNKTGYDRYILRQTSSENEDPTKSKLAVGNYYVKSDGTVGENNEAKNNVEGYFREVGNYTADKWHHIKTQLGRESLTADSKNMFALTARVSVDNDADVYTASYQGGWPYRIQFRTPTRRAIGLYIDNIKVRWNLTGDYTDTVSSLRNFSVSGYDGSIDNSAKTITVGIPMWDENGDAISLGSLTTTARTASAGDSVRVGKTLLSGGTEKTGSVDYTNGGCYVTINGENYKLTVKRVLTEGFDSGISGSFGGFTSNSNWDGNNGGSGTIAITGNARKGWFSAIAEKGGSDSDGSYLAKKSIGFVNSSDVKSLSDSSAVMPAGVTAASGKVLKIDNPSNGNTAGVRNGYGTIGFAVGTSTQCSLAGVPNATQISFEYDIAYGNDSSNSGVISAFMNGAYIGSGSNYSTYGSLLSRNGGTAEDKIESTQKHTYQAGADAGGNAQTSTADISQWRHVKTVFSRTSADSTDITIEFYYDGVKQSKTWTTDKWPDQLSFRGASNRASQIYIDNVKMEWDMAGNYSTVWLDSFNVQDSETEIDEANSSITVSLPLYDTNGNSYPITALLTSAEVTGSGSVMLYYSSEDTDGTVVAENTVIDWSQIGSRAKIVCGEKTYSLKAERRLYDNFDDKTFVSGQTSGADDGSLTWATPLTIKGNVGTDSVYSVGFNENYKSTFPSADKAAHVQNLKVGVYDVSGAKNVGGTAAMTANAGAAPSGNGFKLLKALAYEGGDSYAHSFDINTTKLDGIAKALTVSVDYDTAYDYNEVYWDNQYTFTDNSKNVRVGSTVGGLQINNGSYRITGQNGDTSSDSRASEKLLVFGTASAATLDKWNHVRVEISRTSASDTAPKATVYVNGTAVKTNVDAVWPTKLTFQTSTFRACGIWIDNLDIRYNLN